MSHKPQTAHISPVSMEADPVADPMADPWALADPWQVDPGMAMERENLPVRVRRLNGELLEVSLTKQKANKIELIRELKRCLAKNDPRISPAGQISPSDLQICHDLVPESHILKQCIDLIIKLVLPSLFHQKLGQRYGGSTFLDLVHSTDAHGRGDP